MYKPKKINILICQQLWPCLYVQRIKYHQQYLFQENPRNVEHKYCGLQAKQNDNIVLYK